MFSLHLFKVTDSLHYFAVIRAPVCRRHAAQLYVHRCSQALFHRLVAVFYGNQLRCAARLARLQLAWTHFESVVQCLLFARARTITGQLILTVAIIGIVLSVWHFEDELLLYQGGYPG